MHSAPAHGLEDFIAFRESESKEAIISPVDADGLFCADETGTVQSEALLRLQGKSVLANGVLEVITMLREKKLLLATTMIRHKYPYDWRTKQPVIFRYIT